jgi:serine/threonine-protein kinase
MTTNARWIVWPVVAVAVLAAGGNAAPNPACDPAGRIDGILVGGDTRTAVAPGQLRVVRASGLLPGQNGFPICYHDVVVTGPGVTATLRLTNSQDDQWITLSPETTTEIVDESSIALRIGRVFALLRGRFDVRTVYALLGARGTQFEVGVGADGLDVTQLEGVLDISPVAQQPPALAWAPGRPVLLAAGYGGPAPGRQAAPPPLRLERLTRLTLGRGQPQRILATSEAQVRAIVDVNSVAIAATRPETPSQNVIKVYESREEATRSYREARFWSIWDPARLEYFEKLGNCYADWTEPTRAVRAYQKAAAVTRDSREAGRYYNNIGNAHRLAGELDAAEAAYRRAIDASPSFAFPYNGWGDVYRERALAEADRGRRESAVAALARARELYRKSLDPSLWGKEGGANRAVPMDNLGLVSLHLGEIALADGNAAGVAEAEGHFREAERRFQDALGQSSQWPFPLVGLGRLHAAEAGVYTARGDREGADRTLARAEAQMTRVVTQFPSLAVARSTLGIVLDQAGKTEQAAEQFRRATELDPQYALAYFRLGVALDRLGRADQAQLYFRTYARVESPIFKDGARMAMATGALRPSRAPELAAPERPTAAAAMVPSVVGRSRDEAAASIRAAGFRVGSIEARVGRERPGTVIDQRPKAGERAGPGSPIDLVVASKPAKVPDLSGGDRARAAKQLKDRRLSMGEIREEPSCDRPGTVLRQDPEKDAQVAEGSPVTIVVASLGPRPAVVPDLKGLAEPAARSALRERGLSTGQARQSESEQQAAGTIVRQNPRAGTALAPGCPVEITVAVAVPQVEVPSFIGLTLDEVKSRLPSGFTGYLANFRLGTVTVRGHTDYKPGTVIAQDPAPGTTVPRRPGTPINLVVAGQIQDPR